MVHMFPDSSFTAPAFRSRKWDSGQYGTISTMAARCRFEYGPAVYMARAMLGRNDTIPYLHAHSCEDAFSYSGKMDGGEPEPDNLQQQDVDVQEYKLYPNPNSGLFTVWLNIGEQDRAKMGVWSTSGQKVHETRLSLGNNALSIDVAKGLCLYRITVNDELKWTGKVAVGFY